MTSKRSVDSRLTNLEDRNGSDGEICVVAIGGDPDLPRGWITREEYAEHYGDARDELSEFDINPTGEP